MGAKLAETKLQLGRVLQFDPGREQFVGEIGEAANALLTRNYRPPLVVPAKV